MTISSKRNGQERKGQRSVPPDGWSAQDRERHIIKVSRTMYAYRCNAQVSRDCLKRKTKLGQFHPYSAEASFAEQSTDWDVARTHLIRSYMWTSSVMFQGISATSTRTEPNCNDQFHSISSAPLSLDIHYSGYALFPIAIGATLTKQKCKRDVGMRYDEYLYEVADSHF